MGIPFLMAMGGLAKGAAEGLGSYADYLQNEDERRVKMAMAGIEPYDPNAGPQFDPVQIQPPAGAPVPGAPQPQPPAPLGPAPLDFGGGQAPPMPEMPPPMAPPAQAPPPPPPAAFGPAGPGPMDFMPTAPAPPPALAASAVQSMGPRGEAPPADGFMKPAMLAQRAQPTRIGNTNWQYNPNGIPAQQMAAKQAAELATAQSVADYEAKIARDVVGSQRTYTEGMALQERQRGNVRYHTVAHQLGLKHDEPNDANTDFSWVGPYLEQLNKFKDQDIEADKAGSMRISANAAMERADNPTTFVNALLALQSRRADLAGRYKNSMEYFQNQQIGRRQFVNLTPEMRASYGNDATQYGIMVAEQKMNEWLDAQSPWPDYADAYLRQQISGTPAPAPAAGGMQVVPKITIGPVSPAGPPPQAGRAAPPAQPSTQPQTPTRGAGVQPPAGQQPRVATEADGVAVLRDLKAKLRRDPTDQEIIAELARRGLKPPQ